MALYRDFDELTYTDQCIMGVFIREEQLNPDIAKYQGTEKRCEYQCYNTMGGFIMAIARTDWSPIRSLIID